MKHGEGTTTRNTYVILSVSGTGISKQSQKSVTGMTLEVQRVLKVKRKRRVPRLP